MRQHARRINRERSKVFGAALSNFGIVVRYRSQRRYNFGFLDLSSNYVWSNRD